MFTDRMNAKEPVVYIYIYTHTHNGILLSHKKNEIMPFAATWMDLETIILSEVNQKEIPYDITYMWNLKYDTNDPIYETEIKSQTESSGLQQ